MVAQVSDWFQRFSEPVRLKPGVHSSRVVFTAKSAYFGRSDPHIIGWFRHLAEPVRRKPPLPVACIPFYFARIAYFEFSLSVIETGDTSVFVINSYVVHNRARVTITEVPFRGQANVTIQQINYSRGYS